MKGYCAHMCVFFDPEKCYTFIHFPPGNPLHSTVNRTTVKLVDIHFPPGNPLHSTVNRTTVKVSYRALPNMGAKIARHNAKILKNMNKNSSNRHPPVTVESRKIVLYQRPAISLESSIRPT